MTRSSASKSIGSTTSGAGSSERSMVESGLVMPRAPPGSGDGASVDIHHFHGVVRLAHRIRPAEAGGYGLPRVAAGQHVQPLVEPAGEVVGVGPQGQAE